MALVRSANIGRMPALRTAILDGSFHRTVCPGCGRTSNVETTFFYTDLQRKTLFLALPRRKRSGYREHGSVLQQAASAFPKSLLNQNRAQLRLVYGLDELREKLIAQDANYDDRAVEYLKARLLAMHPVLAQKNRVQLVLHRQSRAHVHFIAYHHNDPQLYELTLTRSAADRAIAANKDLHLAQAAAPKHQPPASPTLDDFWVNFRNWTSRYDALQVLHDLAEDIRNGNSPALEGADFEKLLQTLPRGVDLSSDAKKDLDVLFDYSRKKRNADVERQLLEIRFGKSVKNEWMSNEDEKGLPVLWDVLRNLPAANVEANADFKTIELDNANGGVYQSDGTIEIGSVELGNLTDLAETMRHEVGHAVNEELRATVDPWLEKTFGWKMYPVYGASNAQWAVAIEQWAKAMGGWGPAAPKERKEIAQFLQDCLVQSSSIAGNGGSWNPALNPPFPTGHAWYSKSCLPAQAYQRSGGGTWFSNCAKWLPAGEKRFAVNFYYGSLMEVNAAAINDYVLKEARKDHYGAMSMAEFFAELYALYFDPPEDPAKIIAPAVLAWLNQNIGPMGPNLPALPNKKATSGHTAAQKPAAHSKKSAKPAKPSAKTRRPKKP